MRIVVVASLAWSLVNFRGALLRRLVAEGHQVIACAPDYDPAVLVELERMGVAFVQVPMDRTGTNPIRDLHTVAAMVFLLRRQRPDAVLAYTQKPIIYGGLAARLTGVPFHAMVSGLGHAFGEAWSLRARGLRSLVARFYRHALRRARTVFVFNGDDEGLMRRLGILDRQHVVQLGGSGVDLTQYAQRPTPGGPPTFMMIARLMRDKGCEEFVEAARLVRRRAPEARFLVVGPFDPNPTGITAADVERWRAAGDVDYLGATRDVRPFLAAAHVFVLPSYYREGLPRTILEAMATGRAVITTDQPGCRDAVVDEETGLLVAPRDPQRLADAMQRFVADRTLAVRMGAAGRRRAETHYAVGIINDAIVGAIHRPQEAAHARALGDHRLIERLLATMALFAAVPLLASTAFAVLLSLGRPILFTQVRTGKDGVPFTLRKFRTMRSDTDSAGAPLPDEARMTRTGRVLRRTRLDELPQLAHVAMGTMSFVGPRPLPPAVVAEMGDAGDVRRQVRPGLTGWSQIHGNTRLDDRDKAALDCWYVRHRSLLLDLRILIRTAMVLVSGERIDGRAIEMAHANLAARGG